MAKKSARGSAKRKLIDTGRNKMYGKRGTTGRFKEMDDTSRSLSTDSRTRARKKVKSGFGDQGDSARPAGSRKTTKRKTARKKTSR